MFEALVESAERGELILVDGGLCRWHLRRDGQLTIREIIVLPGHRGYGIGTAMLETLKLVPNTKSIFAKCPAGLPANEWYADHGFTCEGEELTRTNRRLKLWRLFL